MRLSESFFFLHFEFLPRLVQNGSGPLLRKNEKVTERLVHPGFEVSMAVGGGYSGLFQSGLEPADHIYICRPIGSRKRKRQHNISRASITFHARAICDGKSTSRITRDAPVLVCMRTCVFTGIFNQITDHK